MNATLAVLMLASSLASQSELAFSDLDQNRDGYLSFDELRSGAPSVRRETFNDYDLNGDGRLSVTEFKTWRDDHGA